MSFLGDTLLNYFYYIVILFTNLYPVSRKKIVFILGLFILFNCNSNENESENPVEYQIEGKWLLENAGGSDLSPNTMYEFQNGLRYTYYCDAFPLDCDSEYWSSREISDAIPNPANYTIDDSQSLIINGGLAYDITFNCDGKLISIAFTDTAWQWWRIGTDINNCN